MNFRQYAETLTKKLPYVLWFISENGDEYIYFKGPTNQYNLKYIKPFSFDNWRTANDSNIASDGHNYLDLIMFYREEGTIKKELSKQEFEEEWTIENI